MKFKRLTTITFIFSLVGILASCDFSLSTESSSKRSYLDFDEVMGSKTESSSVDDSFDYKENLLTSHLVEDDLTCNTATRGQKGTNYKQVSTEILTKRVSDSMGDKNLVANGHQNILVIPVVFSDFESRATEAARERIYKSFFGKTEDTNWESVASYYYKSSFGDLLINGTVSEWFDYGLTSSEFAKLTSKDVYGQNVSNFDQTLDVLDKAIDWYKERYNTDCKEFDNDGDGRIDGVWLVYSAPSMESDRRMGEKFWAYTFSKYANQIGNADSPIPFRYCWASIDFMGKGYGKDGVDAHTFIHETGHMMGLDDYYDVNGATSSFGGVCMMDCNIGDHDGFSKFGFDWTSPYLVSGDCTINLKPACKTGESVILPTAGGFNGTAYDEYIMLELYTPEGLNEADSKNNNYGPYLRSFTVPGVRIYHVDARMATSRYNTKSQSWGTYSYTDNVVSTNTQITVRAHSNTTQVGLNDTRNHLNPDYRLIQTIDREGINYAKNMRYTGNSSLFKDGDVFTLEKYSAQFPEKFTMNDGSDLPYRVSISNLSSSGVKLTIEKL